MRGRKINKGLPPSLQQRYKELDARRKAETLTSSEYQELLRLIDEIENANVERIRCLAELAHIRETTLTDLMNELEIHPPA